MHDKWQECFEWILGGKDIEEYGEQECLRLNQLLCRTEMNLLLKIFP